MNNQTGDVWTEDKVKYTADEVRALGGYIDLNIHQVKKTMGGVICTPESQLD